MIEAESISPLELLDILVRPEFGFKKEDVHTVARDGVSIEYGGYAVIVTTTSADGNIKTFFMAQELKYDRNINSVFIGNGNTAYCRILALERK